MFNLINHQLFCIDPRYISFPGAEEKGLGGEVSIFYSALQWHSHPNNGVMFQRVTPIM